MKYNDWLQQSTDKYHSKNFLEQSPDFRSNWKMSHGIYNSTLSQSKNLSSNYDNSFKGMLSLTESGCKQQAQPLSNNLNITPMLNKTVSAFETMGHH